MIAAMAAAVRTTSTFRLLSGFAGTSDDAAFCSGAGVDCGAGVGCSIAGEWIGDQAGFEAFQEFRQTRTPAVPYIVPMLATDREVEAKMRLPTFDMIGSLREVIQRKDVPSVFGHPVAVSNANGPS
jgi:hypothetical protein